VLNKNTVSIEQLCQVSKKELAELFSKCDIFAPNELEGRIDGQVINGNLLWVTKYGLCLTNWFWRGKTFYFPNRFGRNYLSLGLADFNLFKFRTNIEDSMEYTGKVFSLRYSYPFSFNPWPIRLIVDEMRKVREGLYLGTGNIKIFGTFYLFDWYILMLPTFNQVSI
jgi:hypothetical protein